MLTNFRQVLVQLRSLSGVIMLTLAASTVLLGAAFALALRYDVSVAVLFRDPLASLGEPFYTGIMSNLGVVIWIGAAAVCGFGYLLLRRHGSDKGTAHFLLASGIISAVLFLDDFLMLHEEVFPLIFGVGEKVVYLVYGMAVLAFLVRFRRLILTKTEWPLLCLAFGGLGASMGTDMAPFPIFARVVVEDMFKFVGITFWTLYFVRTAKMLVLNELLIRVGGVRAMPGMVAEEGAVVVR